MNKDELASREKQILERERRLTQKLRDERQRVFDRFPLLFTLLTSFGLVATIYGFERLIDKAEFFSENPITLLLTGLAVLIFTGTLYKKLQ